MKNRMLHILVALLVFVGLLMLFPQSATAATARSETYIEHSETNGVASRIDVFKRTTGGGWGLGPATTTYEIYLPGCAVVSECFLSWDFDVQATLNGMSYNSGECPIPPVGTTWAYTIGSDTYQVTTYQGSPNVQAVFIEVDETGGKPTISQMDNDPNHEVECSGYINIGDTWYGMTKMKGRGNATWKESQDKKPYNVTLDTKIKFPGLDSDKTKKWSFLAEGLDRSLLGNRIGFDLAHELGIGQDTVSADVWMNGEYQGCYTVTPKTDSFVTKNGFMIEQDNYKEDPVAQGGDPQFMLNGMKEASGWDSCYNRITVKKMGDNLLKNANGEVDESPENLQAAAAGIQSWLQDAWDAIRSDSGYNSKGRYYTEYIDIESFAKMYLMHEYVKSYDFCAGSILFHRDGMTDDDKLIAGPLWDLDNAMGSTFQNSSLGKADNRKDGDRRSAEGYFINNVNEYKTSIYKTLSKHSDFMEEVYRQYNLNREAFESVTFDFEQMAADIAASALMNHAKVIDLGNFQGRNNHYYSAKTTFGSGQYRQTYLATTGWADYATNMWTYLSVRSLWFKNHYTIGIRDGWMTYGGKYYYVVNYGPLANGWAPYNGVYYYIKDFAIVANGWALYDGNYYYIKNYSVLAEGWVSSGGKWYYIRNYLPVVNDWVTYNGTQYHFNDSGVCDATS